LLTRSIEFDASDLTIEERVFVAAKRVCIVFAVAALSISALDLMIAAHAVEHDMTLVTNDRAFSAIFGLRLEDWTQA